MSEHHTHDASLTDMTTDITAAYVANNALDPDKLSNLIREVHHTLSSVASGQADGTAQGSQRKPAVPIRKAVQKDHLVCLECGKKQKMLKRHLAAAHDLTPQQYRERWGLSPQHPMVAPNYSAKRSQLAKDIGLGQRSADG